MRTNLMYADRDLDPRCELPAQTAALSQDLGLGILCTTMAQGDSLIFEVSKRALVLGLTDLGAISYRQAVLADCLERPLVIRRIYDLAGDAVEAERKVWGLYSGAPQSILSRALGATELLLGYLKRLRRISDEHAGGFSSEGFCRFFRMVSEELPDAYFRTIEGHLGRLRFKSGVLISGGLGEGNTAVGLALGHRRRRGWGERGPGLGRSGYSFEISSRDDGGLQVLDNLKARAINRVANALAQSAEHIRGFFTMLRAELAFYMGCTNLRDRLATKERHYCFPQGVPATEVALSGEGLYDVCLALRSDESVVGNDVRADGRSLVMVTGANQGGKSTFLRSIGLAQMMMQAGMFVPATTFKANVCPAIFTHFKREEDPTMVSGKFDEELRRMSDIARRIGPNCLVLCNESFAATNEREGSEVALEVVRALTDARVKVIFVTHMYELAHRLCSDDLRAALFLRAERLADGTRTFRLLEGEPLPTSYGEESYWRVFGPGAAEGQVTLARISPATP